MSPPRSPSRQAKVKALNNLLTPKKKQNCNKISSTTPLFAKFGNLSLKSPGPAAGTARKGNASPTNDSDKENDQNILPDNKKQNLKGRKRLTLPEINGDENLFAPRILTEDPSSSQPQRVLQDSQIDKMDTVDVNSKPKKGSAKKQTPRKNSKALANSGPLEGEPETPNWIVESKSPMKMVLRRSSSRSTTPQRQQQQKTPAKRVGLEDEYNSGEDEDTLKIQHGGSETESDTVTKKKQFGLELEYESEEDDDDPSDKSYHPREGFGTVRRNAIGLEEEYDSEMDDVKHYGIEQEYEESESSDSSTEEEDKKLVGSRYTVPVRKRVVETFEEEPETSQIDLLVRSISKLGFEVMNEDAKKQAEIRQKRERNPLMKIYPLFHTSALPDVLLKRETQCKEIEKFIKQAINAKSSVHNRTIYISGVPGTGKTACVTKVVKKLQTQQRPKLKFDYVYVNGLELIKPEHVFIEIYKVLFPSSRPPSSKAAREKLSKLFTFEDSKRAPILLVIDELDMLCTKSQDVVYDIFDWSSTLEAKLSVVAIANTLDLPERVLKQKVSSRMGYNRLTFQPYNFEEISYILENRIKKSCVSYNKNAFGFIARKVAAVSGDLRKALEFIRRAIEIAVENDAEVLSMEHATAAVKEGLQSLPTMFTKSLSPHQEFLLRSIIQEIRATSLEELDFFLVYECYRRNCFSMSFDPLEICSATGLLSSLQSMGYIDIKSAGLVSRRIMLKTSVDEIDYLLKQMKVTEEV